MTPQRDRGQGRVAALIVLTLDEAARIYQIPPALRVRLEERLARTQLRHVAGGDVGYYSADIEEALMAEQVGERAARGDGA
jgi:hypothetical protein